MAETVFFNVWQAASKEKQEQFVKASSDETAIFRDKPGFLELIAWSGEAGDTRVITEGRWASLDAFNAAVANNADALKGREKLAALAVPSPGLFREVFRVGPVDSGKSTGMNELLPPGVSAQDAAVNGQTIHYLRAGSGPLMLLVHGYPESSRTWLKVMPELAKQFTVIAPDTRGTGGSSLARDFSIQDTADDLYELVHSLGFRDLVLVGQDFGVQVVGAYAARHREDVRALVVMESPLSAFGLEDLFGTFWHFGFFKSSFAELLIQGREDEFFRAFAFGDFVYRKEAFGEEDTAAYIRAQIRPGRLAAGLDYYRAVSASQDFFAKTVTPPWHFPVLAMDGDHSMAGLTAKSFERIQPKLKSLLVPECGHFIQEEQPAFLIDTLLAFFRESGIRGN